MLKAAQRWHALIVMLLAGLAATLATAPAAGASGCSGRVSRSRAVVCDINRVRAAHGLRQLRVNDRLATAARRQARDMVHRDYFSHITPGGSTLVDRLRRSGYLRTRRAWRVGETLGWGMSSAATPAAMVRAWLNSPEHRAILLAPAFRELGVGVAPGVPSSGASGATYAADFGVKR